jgi:hypothetical protein
MTLRKPLAFSPEGYSDEISETDSIRIGNLSVTVGVDLEGNRIVGVANPTLAQDAATKDYVDTAVLASSLDQIVVDDEYQVVVSDNYEVVGSF